MAKETLSKKIQEALIKVGEKIIIDLGAELVLKNRITDATKSRLITEAEVRINGTMIEIWMPQYWEYTMEQSQETSHTIQVKEQEQVHQNTLVLY